MDAPDRRRRISIRGASTASGRARGADWCARGESATGRDVGRPTSRKHTAGRGQAGPRTGDGRAVVLLILGRRGATHPRRGRGLLARGNFFSPARRTSVVSLFGLPLFYLRVAEARQLLPGTAGLSAPRARVLLPSSRCSPVEPAGGCVRTLRGRRPRRRPRRRRDVGTNASW